MVSALAPKPRFAPHLTPPRAPLGKPPLRLVPTLPEPPPPTPSARFGGAAGGALFTISALWSAKTAYDAVKAVPSQLLWMPGKPVDPRIWSDPERVAVEAHARFGHMDTGHLNTLRFVRQKQAMPLRRDPMHDPHDRNLFVQNEEGEWIQVPLAGQQSGALEIGTLWEHGLPGKPMHERAGDELRLVEVELDRRNPPTEKSEADADNSWFAQYINYVHELLEALRKRANGENVPLPILVINAPEETKMPLQTKPQMMCSSGNGNQSVASTNASSVGESEKTSDTPLRSDDVKKNSNKLPNTITLADGTVLFLRPAKIDDVGTLAQLIRDTFSYWGKHGLNLSPSRQSDEKTWEHLSHGGVVVALDPDMQNVIGTVTIHIVDVKYDTNKSEWQLNVDDGYEVMNYPSVDKDGKNNRSMKLVMFEKFAIRTSHSHGGIGQKIYETIVRYAQENAYDGLAIETVEEASWLYGWYRSLGFKTVGLYQYPGSIYKTHFMISLFSPRSDL